MITCLVVDDDRVSREIVSTALEKYGFKMRVAESARSMRTHLRQGGIDMILLDLLLPDGNGIELCRELRAHSEIPIIILSAEIDQITRIVGLEIGADAFVIKPPDCRELIARIRSLTRRTIGLRATALPPAPVAGSNADAPARSAWELGNFEGGGWRVCWRSRLVETPRGLSVPLSNAEFELLVAFAQSPGNALSRKQLTSITRRSEGDRSERNIDLAVSRLRAKLSDSADDPTFIRTIRGFGYRLIPAENLESEPEQ